jgi:hypothetical protein
MPKVRRGPLQQEANAVNQIHTLLCGMLIGATALSGSALAEGSAPAPLGDIVTTRFGELQFTQPFADGYPANTSLFYRKYTKGFGRIKRILA